MDPGSTTAVRHPEGTDVGGGSPTTNGVCPPLAKWKSHLNGHSDSNQSADPWGWIQCVLNLLGECGLLRDGCNNHQKVVKFSQPQKIKEWVTVNESKCSEEKLLHLLERAIESSVRTSHPLFLNQLYGGIDPYGLAAAIVSETLNTSPYTFEVAPVFTLCEEEVINGYLSLVGYENGEGLFSPGGSISNMYAICLARYLKFPEVKKKGLRNLPQMVVFASQDSHYSVLKSANWLGLGSENVRLVKTDPLGRMCHRSLEEDIAAALEEGVCPLIVVATAGTTVLGAVDPIAPLAGICRKHGLFLHIDACLGGSLLFSSKHASKLQGIEMSDSVAWNAHKMLGAPLQCSMFITRHKGALGECNSSGASYLFQKDKMYDSQYDRGDASVQCGRKADAFKLWTMWKARGHSGFGFLVDRAINSARYVESAIRKRASFRLVLDTFDSNNVCFWFIPKRLRGLEENDLWREEMHKVAPMIKSKLVKEGSMMISYQPLSSKNLKNFFRLSITCHPARSKAQLDQILDLIEIHGEHV